MVERGLFRMLGLHPNASSDELRSAYRTLAKKYHPDSQDGSANALAFTRVVDAYQCIMQDRLGARSPFHSTTPKTPSGARSPFHSTPPKTPSGARSPFHSTPPKTPSGARYTPIRKPLTDIFALGRRLLMAGDPSVRAAAARELGKSGKSSAYAFLRKAFLDRDERVLCAVVEAVRTLGIRQSSGELASLSSRSGPAVRKEILKVALGMGPFNGFENILRLAADDPDASVRALLRKAGYAGREFRNPAEGQ